MLRDSRRRQVLQEKHTAVEKDAVLAFKLVCHHQEISHWHTKPRHDKFKAISIDFFAFAVLDAWKTQPRKQWGLGVDLEVIARSFLASDWTKKAIVALVDGTTRVVERVPNASDDINIWVGATQTNSAANVS